MQRTLTITGQASKSFAPDLIQVSLEHTRVFPEYAEVVNEVSERTGYLRGLVNQAGLDGKKLKTSDFSVEPEYETYKDDQGNRRRKLIGYRNHATFEITFPLDNDVLSKLLGEIRESEDHINFSYRLSDVEAAREEVLVLASEAALHKAEVIAKATGVRLGDIQTLDYSVKRIRIDYDTHPYMQRMCGADAANPEIDITPEDLTITDSISMVIEIK